MINGRIPNSLRQLTKKRLLVAALVIGCVLLIILLIVGAVVIAVISAILGQADSSLSKSITDSISTLWSATLEDARAQWQQIIANPLQSLTGDSN